MFMGGSILLFLYSEHMHVHACAVFYFPTHLLLYTYRNHENAEKERRSLEFGLCH